ncbi:Hypp4348 [Branchiostoma lanceolatum]|uniref:Hypp4348 protein n=1 Tax=Branchiostoma lanceolatum TaxID=7740 RepID=A0A8K0A7I1_BRALA|nr:Hypp4348 [Branchiostoma lanceolatum]
MEKWEGEREQDTGYRPVEKGTPVCAGEETTLQQRWEQNTWAGRCNMKMYKVRAVDSWSGHELSEDGCQTRKPSDRRWEKAEDVLGGSEKVQSAREGPVSQRSSSQPEKLQSAREAPVSQRSSSQPEKLQPRGWLELLWLTGPSLADWSFSG